MRTVWTWLIGSIVCLAAAGPAAAAIQMYWTDANYDKISVAPTAVNPPAQVILQFDSDAMSAEALLGAPVRRRAGADGAPGPTDREPSQNSVRAQRRRPAMIASITASVCMSTATSML